jgi:uncharacterized protein YdhG (YjbR/CyaY superfamily)
MAVIRHWVKETNPELKDHYPWVAEMVQWDITSPLLPATITDPSKVEVQFYEGELALIERALLKYFYGKEVLHESNCNNID